MKIPTIKNNPDITIINKGTSIGKKLVSTKN